MFDPKVSLNIPNIWWVAGGLITGLGVIITTVVKVATRHYIPKDEAYNRFQRQDICDEKHKLEKAMNKELSDKIDTLDKNINRRFDDVMRTLNGK